MSRVSIELYGREYKILVSELPTYRGKKAHVDEDNREITVCDLGEHGLLKSLAAAVNKITANQKQKEFTLRPQKDQPEVLADRHVQAKMISEQT